MNYLKEYWGTLSLICSRASRRSLGVFELCGMTEVE